MTVLAIIGMGMLRSAFASVRERVRPAVPTHDDMKNDFKDVWKTISGYAFLLLTYAMPAQFIRMAATSITSPGDGTKHPISATLFISLGGRYDDRQYAGKSLTDRWQ